MTAAIASSQNAQSSNRSTAQMLLQPKPLIPISFEQREEHLRKLADGSSVVEYTISAKSYRNSAGSVRVEGELRDGSGKVLPSSSAVILDRTNNYQISLIAGARAGYRIQVPAATAGNFAFFDAPDETEKPHEWLVTSEDADKTIEGVLFKGTRIVSTAKDDSGLRATFESWTSEKLGLCGGIRKSGVVESFSISIKNLRFEEPDPALFMIPADYQIIDVPVPGIRPK